MNAPEKLTVRIKLPSAAGKLEEFRLSAPRDFGADWKEVPDDKPYDNAFKAEWELFIRHVCEGAPFRWTLLEGAKGLQLVDCALKSWRSRRWVDVPRLKA